MRDGEVLSSWVGRTRDQLSGSGRLCGVSDCTPRVDPPDPPDPAGVKPAGTAEFRWVHLCMCVSLTRTHRTHHELEPAESLHSNAGEQRPRKRTPCVLVRFPCVSRAFSRGLLSRESELLSGKLRRPWAWRRLASALPSAMRGDPHHAAP